MTICRQKDLGGSACIGQCEVCQDLEQQLKACSCSDCRKDAEALRRQLEHPFYKRVDEFRDEVKLDALKKASSKYPEPFNPASWTVKELGKHAMSENYDQGNYIVGLMEKAEELEKGIEDLKQALEKERKTVQYWYNRAKHFENTLNGAIFDKRV